MLYIALPLSIYNCLDCQGIGVMYVLYDVYCDTQLLIFGFSGLCNCCGIV